MIIEIGNFKLVSNENRFHLIELKEVETTDFETKKKTGEKRIKEIEVGYDMTLETGIKYILDRSLNDLELTVSLSEYVKMYKEKAAQITNLLK